MKKWLLVFLVFLSFNVMGQPVPRKIKTQEYKELQTKLAQGWNTWYNNNLLSHVHLPEGFSVNLAFNGGPFTPFVNQIIKHKPGSVRLDMRSSSGKYTSLEYVYNQVKYFIESATVNDELYICVTPEKESITQLIVEANLPWDTDGFIGTRNNCLLGHIGDKEFKVQSVNERLQNNYTGSVSPKLVFALDKDVCIYTGKATKTRQEIKNLIHQEKMKQQQIVDSYGSLSEEFKAMKTVLSWNTMYDAANKRVISPVSREWSLSRGGFVIFDWDTYFASYMFGLFDKDLAYANAIEITKSITPAGFIPNYEAPFCHTSYDRSQPPIGSMVIYELYKHYGDKWLLEETYDELLTWNRWWAEHRDINGYLAWGSDKFTKEDQKVILEEQKQFAEKNGVNPSSVYASMVSWGAGTWQGAAYESGLDNSPIFDGIKFNQETDLMELADVGLMSFYIMDCNYLIDIAKVLDRKEDIKELKKRKKKYEKSLATMWSEEDGIYLNKHTDTGKLQHVLTPCNFYPLLAKVCTQKQAETMMEKHYFNPEEFHGEYVIPSVSRDHPAFKDNKYWRGRIWAPMNFLVYKGMCNYKLDKARLDLVERSKKLMMKNWNENGGICENYDCVTGHGGVGLEASDSFYHWGALLGFMSFLENGYMK